MLPASSAIAATTLRLNCYDSRFRGEKDVPLMICDRSFDKDGSFLYPSLDPSLQDKPSVEDDYMDGVLGDTMLVNGAPWPVLEVSNTRYRFRILNASNAHRYELALQPG